MSLPITTFVIDGTDPTSVTKAVSSLAVSWTLDGVSEVSATIVDPGMKMFKANYFQVRREATYAGSTFEVASVEVKQGEGAAAEITLECRRRAIQRMKRDKSPNSIAGATATDYARNVASKFGLGFVGERTSVKQTIAKVTAGSAEESTWDVLARAAGEAQFVVFESDGTLYFASQEWLVGKWGNLTFTYPSPESDGFQLLELPNCRQSDDDPNVADFKVLLQRENATQIRPGMTVTLSGMGQFDLRYLVTEVAYTEGYGDPVAVSGRTPEKIKPKT